MLGDMPYCSTRETIPSERLIKIFNLHRFLNGKETVKAEDFKISGVTMVTPTLALGDLDVITAHNGFRSDEYFNSRR